MPRTRSERVALGVAFAIVLSVVVILAALTQFQAVGHIAALGVLVLAMIVVVLALKHWIEGMAAKRA